MSEIDERIERLMYSPNREPLIRGLVKEHDELVAALRQCYCAIQGYRDTNRLHDDSVLNLARLAAKAALKKAGALP